MNSVNLIGRTTKDIEIRYTQGSGTAVVKFTLAVDRGKNQNGEKITDFISCQAWGKIAEILGKYVKKGNRIGMTGHIETGSYKNKDGLKIYTTDVIAEKIEFLEKMDSPNEPVPETPTEQEHFVEDLESDEGLPF